MALARHEPTHIYFTGRNANAAQEVATEVAAISPSTGTTFLKMHMESLISVKKGTAGFKHDRLDLLMYVQPAWLLHPLTNVCFPRLNAGVMFIPAGLSKDGFENQFAINHLAHAMIVNQLLPTLTRTAELPNSDVRVLSLTSTAWAAHAKDGITFATLNTEQKGFMGLTVRYA
jgi:NAD(P)-dependent dehydrogenase (short-subunit alcohol dehydrogenase family)